MGAKLPAGQHTRQATSPHGDPYQAEATDAGTWHMVGGVMVWFLWDAAQGVYRSRVPPPNGPWHFLEFDPEENVMLYVMGLDGQSSPIEHGRDQWHGV